VVIITTLVFGLITPPYGLSLLVASKYVGISFGKAVIRSLPLYIVFFLTIAFTVMYPKVVLWLPKQFLPESVGASRVLRGGLHLPAVTRGQAKPNRRADVSHRTCLRSPSSGSQRVRFASTGP
jgi:hypothetical protein